MAATPLFLVTNVGLAAASVATPTGPYVHITSFAIGSAYGYTPLPTDTGLNGNLLYSGVPTSYTYVGDNTISITLQIPPDAGPFDFGEVAVYLDGGVLFGKAVFDTLQTKFTSLGTNLLSTYTFNCLIKLAQSTAIFKIDTASGIPPSVWNVDLWSDVYPPGISANPTIPLTLVGELDNKGNSSLLHRASDQRWTLGTNYELYVNGPLISGTTTAVSLAASLFKVSPVGTPNRQFVIETSDGYFRSVASVVASGANYQFNLNPAPLAALPTVGSNIIVHQNTFVAPPVSFSDLINVPLMAYGTRGIGRPLAGVIMGAPGDFAVLGMLQGAPGSGRILTPADNLNDTHSIGSGLYQAGNVTGGFPANWPPVGALDGAIQVYNAWDNVVSPIGLITQTWFPTSTGGGDSTGLSGVPPYFRSCIDPNAQTWTAWMPFKVTGRLDPNATNYEVRYYATAGGWSEGNGSGYDQLYTITVASIATSGDGARVSCRVSVDGVLIGNAFNWQMTDTQSQCVTVKVKANSGIYVNATTPGSNPGTIMVQRVRI